MTQTRFKLPPRAKAAPDIDQWVAAEIRPPVEVKTACSKDMSAPVAYPFLPDALTARRRDIQALIAANEALMKGALAVARCNLEIFSRTMAELTETMRAMVNPGAAMWPPRTGIDAPRRATANVRELSEIILHGNVEAVEILTRRFVEAVEEVMPPANAVSRMQQ
jgi:hypothetical protein